MDDRRCDTRIGHDGGLPLCDNRWPCLDHSFKMGMKIRIPKGTTVWSMHPQLPGKREGGKPAGRTYVVTVSHSYPAIHRAGYEKPAEVVWVGKGGYWSSCATAFVEVVEVVEE